MNEKEKKILRQLGTFRTIETIGKNQIIVYFEYGELFYSHNSIIAVVFFREEKYYLFEKWDYSVTTTKYRKRFLDKDKKAIDRDIKNNVAVLV